MPVLFLDCLTGMVELWQRVLRPEDPPIQVNIADGQPDGLPSLLDGFDICINDHTFFDADLLARCSGPSAHRFSRHRRLQLHRSCCGGEPGHQGPHHQGLWRYQRGRAHYRPRHGGGAQRGAHGSRRARRPVAADRRAAALRQDSGDHRPRRCRPRGRAHRTRVWACRCSPGIARRSPRRACSSLRWSRCWRPPTSFASRSP